MTPRLPFLAAFLAALILAGRARAQCLTPDNLDGGPCCGLTQAQLPVLPAFAQNAQSICWLDCGVSQTSVVKTKWSKLNIVQPGLVPPCGEELMRLEIRTPTNLLMWRGNVRLLYTRTFWVIDTNGLARQVWRYLAHGDLTNFAAAGTPPCPVPPCAASFGNLTYYSGYVDFAEDCSIPGGGFDMAWMLTHACDGIDHVPGFPRGGVFHPNRSYTFVGPNAGFVAGPIQPIEGTALSNLDSIRQRYPTTAPSTVVCTYEEPVTHTLTPQSQLCFCGLPGAQFMIANVVVQSQSLCFNAVRTPPTGPVLPGYVSMGIGAWTNPNVFPGQQALRWNVAGYDVVDGCVGTASHLIYYGVTTIGGFPAFDLNSGGIGGPLPPTFIDQASTQFPNGAPTMGRPHQSYHLVYLNH